MTEDRDFTRQKLRANNAPDVHFDGVILHEYTTQDREKSKDRWTELRLWETRGGSWVAEKVGCSTRRGEGELRDILVIGTEEERAPIVVQQDDELYFAWCKQEVMTFFGWTIVAKAFAKAAGWDVVRRVE